MKTRGGPTAAWPIINEGTGGLVWLCRFAVCLSVVVSAYCRVANLSVNSWTRTHADDNRNRQTHHSHHKHEGAEAGVNDGCENTEPKAHLATKKCRCH